MPDKYRTDQLPLIVEYGGRIWRRWPNGNRSDAVYYHSNHERLHRRIWQDNYGEIPVGYHIHHLDRNSFNNDIDNLDCVDRSEHVKAHSLARAEKLRTDEDWLAHLANIRPSATEWHRSPEGRKWHSEHARRIAAAMPMRTGICEECDEAFLSKRPRRFCGTACKQRSYYYDPTCQAEFSCKVCGEHFRAFRAAQRKRCDGCSTRTRRRNG